MNEAKERKSDRKSPCFSLFPNMFDLDIFLFPIRRAYDPEGAHLAFQPNKLWTLGSEMNHWTKF